MGPFEGVLAKARSVEKMKKNMRESLTSLARNWSYMSEGGLTAEMGVVMAFQDLSEPVKDSAI